MSTQRVFVIWSHPLFHESVRLLLDHPEIKLVGATSDDKLANKLILDLQPSTILIEDKGSGIPTEVMKLLKACPWNVRVVVISLADNQLNMYRHEQRTMGQADDLVHLILSDAKTGGY